MKPKLDSEKLLKHLNEKWHGQTCPMCKTGNWNVSDAIFELREFNEGSLVIGGGPLIPVVPITCNNCGNTVLVNAIVSKLVDK
jgi:hypothetical protein